MLMPTDESQKRLHESEKDELTQFEVWWLRSRFMCVHLMLTGSWEESQPSSISALLSSFPDCCSLQAAL